MRGKFLLHLEVQGSSMRGKFGPGLADYLDLLTLEFSRHATMFRAGIIALLHRVAVLIQRSTPHSSLHICLATLNTGAIPVILLKLIERLLRPLTTCASFHLYQFDDEGEHLRKSIRLCVPPSILAPNNIVVIDDRPVWLVDDTPTAAYLFVSPFDGTTASDGSFPHSIRSTTWPAFRRDETLLSLLYQAADIESELTTRPWGQLPPNTKIEYCRECERMSLKSSTTCSASHSPSQVAPASPLTDGAADTRDGCLYCLPRRALAQSRGE